MKIITGIDPGKKGAICKLSFKEWRNSISYLGLCPTIKVGKKEEYNLPAMVQAIEGSDLVCIEKVHAMPKQGVTSMFTFGMGYGIWLGIITALQIPVRTIAPQTWKKVMLKDMRKEKNSSIIRAKELYPTIYLRPTPRCRKDSDALAEAFLIARYGWDVIVKREFDGRGLA